MATRQLGALTHERSYEPAGTFMLVGAMNPCFCGNYGDRTKPCTTCVSPPLRRTRRLYSMHRRRRSASGSQRSASWRPWSSAVKATPRRAVAAGLWSACIERYTVPTTASDVPPWEHTKLMAALPCLSRDPVTIAWPIDLDKAGDNGARDGKINSKPDGLTMALLHDLPPPRIERVTVCGNIAGSYPHRHHCRPQLNI